MSITIDRDALISAISRRTSAAHREAVDEGAAPSEAVLHATLAGMAQLIKHFARASDHQAELIAGLQARVTQLEGER
jgi:hypothetical protein